ncbi:hypothetical protein BH24ACT19_BH24ACT19_06720 [soil metagenome]
MAVTGTAMVTGTTATLTVARTAAAEVMETGMTEAAPRAVMMMDGVATQVRAVTLERGVTPVTETAATVSTAVNPEAFSPGAVQVRAAARALEPAKMVTPIRVTVGTSSIAAET